MSDGPETSDAAAPQLTAAVLRAFREALLRMPVPKNDGQALELIEEMERTKAALAATQAATTTVVARRRRTTLQDARDQARAAGKRGFGHIEASIGAEIGLARRESPTQGRTHLELADALTHDLPHTLTALFEGDINEERALIIARETADLTAEDRSTLDAELFGTGHYDDTIALGDHQLRDLLRRIAYRLDADGTTTRWAKARARRRVTTRNLGDGTARLSAIIAIEHAATVATALDTAAETARNAGDPRTRDQVKADTLVARITGTDSPAAPDPDRDAAPVLVNLLISAETLLGDSTEPGHVPGIGPIPAAFAHHWVARATTQARAALRRLFTAPTDRDLVAMESGSRTFPPALAELIGLRDTGTCRTPWCNAPIRHHDHAPSADQGGTTSFDNGQGLCEACNYIKETPDWITWVTTTPTGRQEIGTVTPSGHTYATRPPPQPGNPRPHTLRGEFYLPEHLTLVVSDDYDLAA
ncbi:HNH endonuclease [Nocardia salmonicida]|uniref:HNH endonuclease n=1 Tax=Nocardia salmonicida TaxID=53431 RepID=UPI0033D215D7